jgi:predicted nucleotidyltransferase
MVNIEERAALLAAVERRVPPGCVSVWLTGSRAKGTQRPDSDWDVLVLHPDAPNGEREVFDRGTFREPMPDGTEIDLIVAHPDRLRTDHRYFADCRQFGIRLR